MGDFAKRGWQQAKPLENLQCCVMRHAYTWWCLSRFERQSKTLGLCLPAEQSALRLLTMPPPFTHARAQSDGLPLPYGRGVSRARLRARAFRKCL